jgi:hypothetical protein
MDGDGTPSALKDVGDTAGTVGDRAGSRLERMGLERTTGSLLLVVVGVLVLAFPELISLTVGVGAIVLGVLALASAEGVLGREES